MGIFAISILLVGSLTFSGTYLLFRKNKMNPVKRLSFWLTVFVATPISYVACLAIWFAISSSYPHRTFDQADWANKRNDRYEYVDDLVNNNKAIGLTQKEVISMLGKPDEINDSTLTYYIGYCPKYFMNNDPDWLEINFINGKSNNSRVIP